MPRMQIGIHLPQKRSRRRSGRDPRVRQAAEDEGFAHAWRSTTSSRQGRLRSKPFTKPFVLFGFLAAW